MNRKTFLASLVALITAPFVAKPKPDPKLELEAWIKANPELYTLIICKSLEHKMQRATFNNLKEAQEKFQKDYIQPILKQAES